MPTNEARRQIAIDAVRAAARVTASVQASLDDVRAMTKDDASPVTIGDLAAQAVIAAMLGERDPGRPLVGEEDAHALRDDAHTAHRVAALNAARLADPGMTEAQLLDAIDMGNAEPTPEGFWTLDPIDGTKGFLRGQQYAIALAYIEQGEPIAAAMACPNLAFDPTQQAQLPLGEGTAFSATESSAAQAEELAGPRTTEIAGHQSDRPIIICGSVEKAHSNTGWMARTIEALAGSGCSIGDRLPMDSQAKYAAVARGQADAYLRLPSRPGYVEAIWDHAAGSLIARRAGAVVTDIDGRELDFATGDRLTANRGIVCASPAFHGRLIDAIASAAPVA